MMRANQRECLIGMNRTMRKRYARQLLKAFEFRAVVDPISAKRWKREGRHQGVRYA